MPVYFDGKNGWISLCLNRSLYPAVVKYLGNLPKDVVIYNHFGHYASQRSRSKLFGKSTLVLCSASSTPGVLENTSMKDYTCTFPIFSFTLPSSFIEYAIADPMELIVLVILHKCCLVKFLRPTTRLLYFHKSTRNNRRLYNANNDSAKICQKVLVLRGQGEGWHSASTTCYHRGKESEGLRRVPLCSCLWTRRPR